MQDYRTIRLEKDDKGVARLTLARPEKHNALNAEMIDELHHAAEALALDKAVRVVVLTGEGRSFCAGGDLEWFRQSAEADPRTREREGERLARMLYRLATLPKPLIGRINGQAFGGGVGMISVCDITVGDASARFGLTEVRLGLVPATISPYVVRRIGAANARKVMLSGALFDALRADEIGLLDEIVATEDLDGRVNQIVADHLEAAPNAVAVTKELISWVAEHSLEEALPHTARILAKAWESEEGRIGIEAFLTKKLPPWRNRSEG